MVPERAPEEPRKLNFASPSPWNTLPREVPMDLGRTQINDGETTESPVDGHDQPKIYTIRDHTLEVLMHPSVLELHAVRVEVYTTWRGTAIALESASTVWSGRGDCGCIGGYGCPSELDSEGIFFGRISEAQPKTGALEGRKWRNYGWGYP